MTNNQGNQLANLISLIFTSMLMIILLPFIFLVFLIDYFQQRKNDWQSSQSTYNFEEINISSYLSKKIQPVQESN